MSVGGQSHTLHSLRTSHNKTRLPPPLPRLSSSARNNNNHNNITSTASKRATARTPTTVRPIRPSPA